MRTRRFEHGFSLLELVVTAGVVAIIAGVAVVMLRPAQRVADLRTAVADTANAIRMKASAAARGGTEYVGDVDIRVCEGIAINPRDIDPPTGTHTTRSFALQGGTGTAYREGSRDVVSIVMCEVEDHANAYAIVVGTAGHTEVRRYDEENRTWVTCDER
jgi:prepilin-type N-terminal cleavage/methylation domain-containing protein